MRVVGFFGVATETAGRVLAEQALWTNEERMRGQKEAFQAAINGAPLEASLSILARMVTEETAGEARTAFYIAEPDDTCMHSIRGAGDMPEAYTRQVDGFRVGDHSLACGLAVAATGRPVLTADVFAEPLWKPWLYLADAFDFRGCWSFPIATRDGKTVGTFAMYFRAPREATPRDLPLADAVTQAAAIIIARYSEAQERARAEAALRASEERLRAIYDGTYEYIGLLSPDGTLLEANRASLEFGDSTRGDLVGRPFWETVWFVQTPGRRSRCERRSRARPRANSSATKRRCGVPRARWWCSTSRCTPFRVSRGGWC